MRAEGLTADEIKHGLRYPLERITHLPVAHYVRYACCMQSGDASGALANLHRYFDLQAKYSAWKPPTDKVTHAAGEPVAQQVKKPPVHYAALSLAATHHRFGNIPEATHAVLEAIKFAQVGARVTWVRCFSLTVHSCYVSQGVRGPLWKLSHSCSVWPLVTLMAASFVLCGK